MNLEEFFSVWDEVFRNWKYTVLSIVIGIVFYTLNVLLIQGYQSLISIYIQQGFLASFKFFLNLFVGFHNVILLSSFVSLIIISILLGILFSLITYKTIMLKAVSEKTNALTTAGIFLGILAPGCAACGVGLLSVLGISSAFLTFLPFGGLEISLLAIAIILFSIYNITNNINKGNLCEISKV